MMNLDEILDLLDETAEEGVGMPLTGKRLVDPERLHNLVDDIRLNLPTEIRTAKAIVNDRAQIVQGAKKEAEQIIAKAEERARMLVNEQKIVKGAAARATEILQAAQQNSKEMRSSINEYCDKTLRTVEEQIVKSLTEIKAVRNTLRQKK